MPTLPAPPSPELLYLLSGDEEDLLAACENLRPADVAEALNQLPVEASARVVSALPFELAVKLLDEPELDRPGRYLRAARRPARRTSGRSAFIRPAGRALPRAEGARSNAAPPRGRRFDPGRAQGPARLSAYQRGRHHVDGIPRRAGHLDGRPDQAPYQRGGPSQGNGLRHLRAQSGRPAARRPWSPCARSCWPIRSTGYRPSVTAAGR